MRQVLWLILGVSCAWAGPRHEFVSPAFLKQFAPGQSRLVGDGALPEAVERRGRRVPAPPSGAATGPSIQRQDTVNADRQTVGPARADYHASFNPSVVPWRRDTVMNAVREDHELYVRSEARVVVPVGPRRLTAGFEPFWADVTVVPDARGAPIPSVGPQMRVVALEAQPPVAVRVERDEAHNYFAMVAPGHDRVRLRILVEVNSAYFGRPLSDTVPLDTLADDPDAALPPSVAKTARGVLARIGVRPQMSYAAGVAKLVAWFRGFEERPFEGGTSNIYRDLALGRVGVCRHRAFAFMITARAAGVPTRYIQNEAHAFVELLGPDGAWRRVDLGGGVAEVSVHRGEDKARHQPGGDPFEQPEGVIAAPGASPGMQITGAGVGDAPKPAQGEATAASGGAGEGAPAEVESGASTVPLPRTVTSAPPEGPTPGRPVRLTLTGPAQQVFRGEALPQAVRGRLTNEEGAPLAGQRIQLYLLPAQGDPLRVGTEVRTDAQGEFRATIIVPPTASLGRHRLVAASEAGEGFGAGRSDVQP